MTRDRDNADLDAHELLRGGVGKHETREFAEFVGCSVSAAEKYMREPTSDEEPNATGIVNPLLRVDRIFDWFLLRHPDCALLLAERYPRRLRRFREAQAQQPVTEDALRSHLLKTLDENNDVIKALVGGSPVAVIRRELAQFNAEVEQHLCRIEANEKIGGGQ